MLGVAVSGRDRPSRIAPPRVLLLLLVALGLPAPLAGCGAPADPDEPAPGAAEPVGAGGEDIQGGHGDVVDRAVVGLATTDAQGNVQSACSGSLVAPGLVLTAQHCVASTSEAVDCATSRFGAPLPAAQLLVTTDAGMWTESTVWLSVQEVAVPDGAPSVCGRDLALLTLAAPVPALRARPLTPALDDAVVQDEAYSAVGFGITSPGGTDSGGRRRRDGLRVTCVGGACGEGAAVDAREWQGDHGACDGDSGGPALDGAGRVVGVTSRGPAGCDDPVYGGLVGHRDWIRRVAVAAAAAGRYPAPAWTAAPPASPSIRQGKAASGASFPGAAGGCSSAPLPEGADGHPGAGLSAVLLVSALVASCARNAGGRRPKRAP